MMRITVRDIASQAGVSPATVSLVLNNKKGVSEQTRRRVQEVLDSRGYRPSPVRRQQSRFRLVIIKYRAHGLALEENQGFIASIIDQIELECRRLDFQLNTRNCDAQHADACVADIQQNPPDGVIMVGTELSREDYWVLDRLRVPLVVLDNSMRFEKWDSVVMDNEDIVRTAVLHLHELGHRQIGYFKSSRQINNLDERYAGYLLIMNELGLSVPEPTQLATTLNGAYRDMKKLIESGQFKPQGAVVADNDSIAIGAAKAIQEAGYNIPRDLSIIGVDDIPYSAVTTPALSTVRISRSTLGTLAVEMLQRRVLHPDWPTVHVRIAGNLIQRASTHSLAPKER